MAPNRRRNRNYILAVASLLVIVVACIVAAGCTSTPGAAAGLAGTSWTLASLAGEDGSITPVLDDTAVTAAFSVDGRVGGSAGCNHYSAGYTAEGADLTIEPAVRTEMYCIDPPGVMDQEDRYLALLTEVASYRVEDDLLILADRDGADLLIFEQVVRTPNLPLVGTEWVLESYSTGGDAISSLVGGTTITAQFAADGTVTGNSGCNHYGGEYGLDGTKLSVSSLYSTLMYCTDPGVMEQEARYMSLLGNVSSYRVESNRLTLTDETGTDLLVFVQAREVPPAPLAGTSWTLESYSLNGETVSSVIVGTTITAEFSPDGNVTGSGGCNSYGAGYKVDGMSLSVSSLYSTKMNCNKPEGLMEQENRYFNLLTAATGYRIEGDRLDLLDEDGTGLLSYRAERGDRS
ncbi:META domain-containing protein [Methanoculleus oceani]|uniref:META domain-containing protein n=1 Tax=Methanoculleus oceani TaxID=2184756 RepID=A0ABD4TDE5_9EURY|nr:META domain-containing protein [Methanoculleus sp. CWC-02]MCM2466728.1 META domain-containing protein [Methanoculleus sp. CWC-02]